MFAGNIYVMQRPCGDLEAWSIHRGRLGIYLNVISAAKYTTKDSSIVFANRVRTVTHNQVNPQHTLLDCIIIGADSNEVSFQRVSRPAESLPISIQEAPIEELWRTQHDKPMSDEEPWRVIISPAGKDNQWVTFVFNHALGDGTSGMFYHDALLRGLNEERTYKHLSLPSAVEDIIDLRPSWWKLLSKVKEILPLPAVIKQYLQPAPFYCGQDVAVEDRMKTRTGFHRFVVPVQTVAKLRTLARREEVSIHVLLHACVMHAIHTDLDMISSTPINLRPLLKEEHRKVLTNYVTGHYSRMKRKETLIETAKAFYKELNDPQKRREALQEVGLLRYLKTPAGAKPGMETLLLKRVNVARGTSITGTFEVSNIGNWIPPITHGNCSITELHFSGSDSIIGEVYNFCVITLNGGYMSVACTWRTGTITAEEALSTIGRVERSIYEL